MPRVYRIPPRPIVQVLRAACLLAVLLTTAACQSRPDHLAVEDDLTDASWSLVDQDSTAVTFPDAFLGTPALVGPIYTHCPDVCLMTMANMKNVRQALGADTAAVRFVTLSFDPARDTPAVLRRYAETWGTGDGWTLLTGDTAEVARLMARLGIRYEIAGHDTLASGTPTYTMLHTDRMLLLDAEGRIVETYGGSMAIPDMVADDIRALH